MNVGTKENFLKLVFIYARHGLGGRGHLRHGCIMGQNLSENWNTANSEIFK